MAENSLYTKQTNIGLFGAVFLFFLEKKNTVTVKILRLNGKSRFSLWCLKRQENQSGIKQKTYYSVVSSACPVN